MAGEDLDIRVCIYYLGCRKRIEIFMDQRRRPLRSPPPAAVGWLAGWLLLLLRELIILYLYCELNIPLYLHCWSPGLILALHICLPTEYM